jgi:hypothetical protein
MTLLELDVNRWAEEQFGGCALGDQRRTRRAVQVAAQFAADPSGSTTRQTESWDDCKAAYRLMNQEDVTFRALAEPHWRNTRAQTTGEFLLLGDTTTLDFGIHRQVEGLGPVGDGGGRGFLLHSSLLVSAEGEEIFGLAGQTIYHRKPVPEGETFRQRLARERESKIWGEVIDLVGPAPAGVSFTHVFDRGADNFEVYCRLVLSRTGWVVRAAQRKRRIHVPGGKRCRLDHYLDALLVSGNASQRIHQPATVDPPKLESLVNSILDFLGRFSRWRLIVEAERCRVTCGCIILHDHVLQIS